MVEDIIRTMSDEQGKHICAVFSAKDEAGRYAAVDALARDELELLIALLRETAMRKGMTL